MCWTESRVQKVQYFKNVGMWFLHKDNTTCYSTVDVSSRMQLMQSSTPEERREHLMDQCCVLGDYWTKRNEHFASQREADQSEGQHQE